MVAIFAVVGIAVVDGYGVSLDAPKQRLIAQMNIDYAVGAGDLPTGASDRYYGVAFEAPLLLVERLLGLTDSRAIFLSRHLLTHLFFLAGGWFCYLLACHLFGDRYLALFALLLFLLHPRIYAHSFFNSKDLPFLAAFMIALYLAQHAFRRGTVAAFAACGVGVGALINLRIMGAMLFAAVAGLRALDLMLARNRAGRRLVAVTAAAFALAAAGTLYALSPYLWRDPLAIADAFTGLAWHPSVMAEVFQGRWVRWPSIPPHYLPTYVAITTPPATLLLCLIGAGAALGRAGARPGSLIRNTRLRFEWLLLTCLALPIAAVIALNSNIYDGWRQMYFLYAPLCLLAVCGLRALLAAARRLRSPAAARLRRGVSALAAAALVTTAADVVRLHPNQEAYFNFLVDRRTPEHVRNHYDLLYWDTEYRQPLEYLLARYPDSTLYVDGSHMPRLFRNRALLPAAARRRILFTRHPLDEAPGHPATFYVNGYADEPPLGPVVDTRIYQSKVLEVITMDLSLVDPAIADRYRAAYRAAVAGEPLARTEFGFDLYLEGGTLTYAKESCGPKDTKPGFVLRAVPVDVEREEANLHFHFGRFGVRVDGHCLIRRPLPDYPIRMLKVGRGEREDEPSAAIDFETAAADNERDGRAAVCAAGPATPVYRNPYPNVECHPNPLPLPRPVGLRLEGCAFDVKNNLLYAINQFSDRAFAYRDGIYRSDYDVPFPDRSVTGLTASPRWQGATFLPAKYDHAMLVLANRDGSVWGFSDLSADRIARGEPARVRDAKYDLGGAQIDADVRTGEFVAAGVTYDTVRDRLYLASGGNAVAFTRNPPNTAWVRDAASDVAGAGGAGLTFDGLSLLSAPRGGGVSAWTEGAASPGISIPPEELQRLAGNVWVRGLAWDGSNLYLCDRNNNTVWAVPAPDVTRRPTPIHGKTG